HAGDLAEIRTRAAGCVRAALPLGDEADRSMHQSIDYRRQFLEVVADHDDVGQGFSLEARLAVAVDVVPQFLSVVVYPIEADDEALQRLQVVPYRFIGDVGRD